MSGYVGIPSSYTPVEYIESTGTQYIDTGIYPYQTELEVQFQYTSLSTITYLSGSYNDNDNRYGLIVNRPSNNDICYGDRSNNYYTLGTADTNIHTIVYNNSSHQVIYDNVAKGTISDLTATATRTLYLFAYHVSTGVANFASARIMYCKIKNKSTNELIRDFIPVLDYNNVACLYDQVEGKFYYNQGSGTFTAGTTSTPVSIGDKARKITKAYVGVPASYTPVEYIESTGTQYIDTGVNGTWSSTLQFISKFAFTQKVSSAEQTFIGNKDTSNQGTTVYVSTNTTNLGSWCGSGTGYQIGTFTVNADNNLDITFTKPQGRNGTYNGSSFNSTTTANNYTSNTVNIAIFSSKAFQMETPAYMKLYFLKIKKEGVLVRDFIPVLDQDNVACLYDLIERKFYYNLGTGTFTAGSATGQPVLLGSIARRIKKGYIGISGVARLCFGSSKPNYTMLYAYGDNAESGGFFYTRIRKTGDNKENAFTNTNYQINATNIYVYGSQPSTSFNSYGGMITNNSFDMTGYTKVYAKTAMGSATGYGTEIYIPTFQGTTYDLGNNATSSVSFKINGNGVVEVSKPNNVFSISKTDTRRLGLGIASLGWRGNVAARLYVLAMFKADNVTPLANILGVSADINSILAVSSQLLSNETACVCMIGTCTGDFMITALNDSTFRTNLNNSAYKNLILSNEHWNKFYGYLTT